MVNYPSVRNVIIASSIFSVLSPNHVAIKYSSSEDFQSPNTNKTIFLKKGNKTMQEETTTQFKFIYNESSDNYWSTQTDTSTKFVGHSPILQNWYQIFQTGRNKSTFVMDSKGSEKEAQTLNFTKTDRPSISFKGTFEEKDRSDGYRISKAKESAYSVLLVMNSRATQLSMCTGSLLTEEWVLTAAHCITKLKLKLEYVVIYAGGNSKKELDSKTPAVGSQTLQSHTFFSHPYYEKSSTNDFDVALVKADEKFELTATVNVVELSTTPWTFHSYKRCKFTGFGIVQHAQTTEEDMVRKTHLLRVKKPCLCSFRFRMIFGDSTGKKFICSQPKEDFGICSGDSGGALVCNGKIKATAMSLVQMANVQFCKLRILNWSFKCGSEKTFSIFLSTCPHLRWINNKVGLFENSDISPKCKKSKGKAARPTCRSLVVWVIFVISLVNILNFPLF